MKLRRKYDRCLTWQDEFKLDDYMRSRNLNIYDGKNSYLLKDKYKKYLFFLMRNVDVLKMYDDSDREELIAFEVSNYIYEIELINSDFKTINQAYQHFKHEYPELISFCFFLTGDTYLVLEYFPHEFIAWATGHIIYNENKDLFEYNEIISDENEIKMSIESAKSMLEFKQKRGY